MEAIRIAEAEYGKTMREKIEPFLAEIRREGFFDAKDGFCIHYEMYVHPQSVASVIIAHGFTESAEKFREMAYRCYGRGYSVFALDHRGHGRSDRLVMPEYLTHVENFADYVEDFERFVDLVVRPNSGSCLLLPFGHSMGGAIVALALVRRPDAYAGAVLNAPMIQASTNGIPLRMAQVLTRVMCAIGLSKKRMPGFAKGYDPEEDFDKSCSMDRSRFNYYQAKRRMTPCLRNTSPTIGWVKNAMEVPDVLLNPANAGGIRCPVLLLQAEHDHMVENAAQERFIERMPNGRLVQIKGSKHEIAMSPDDVLERYYDTMLDFLDSCR